MTPRKFSLYLFCAILGFPASLAAEDRYYSANLTTSSCISASAADVQTSVTLFGDSRIDWADQAPYGWSPGGWTTFFDLGAPRDWNVQNLSVVAWTTENVFTSVLQCLQPTDPSSGDYSPLHPGFVTAKRYVVNAGGNDYILNSITALYMPWRLPRMSQHVTRNQEYLMRLLVVALKKQGLTDAQARENILWLATLPAVARLPISGTVGEQCFPSLMNECTGPFAQTPDTISAIQDSATSFLERNVWLIGGESAGSSAYRPPSGRRIADFVESVFGSDVRRNLGGDISTGNPYLDAYLNWIAWNREENSHPWTLTSFLVYSSRPLERAAAERVGVHYLDLYPEFTNWRDCAAGFCWGANPDLFQDPVHFNVYGYSVIGFHLGQWMAARGWESPWAPPAAPVTGVNDGDIAEIGTDGISAAEPLQTEDAWFIIGLCFLFGICH